MPHMCGVGQASQVRGLRRSGYSMAQLTAAGSPYVCYQTTVYRERCCFYLVKKWASCPSEGIGCKAALSGSRKLGCGTAGRKADNNVYEEQKFNLRRVQPKLSVCVCVVGKLRQSLWPQLVKPVSRLSLLEVQLFFCLEYPITLNNHFRCMSRAHAESVHNFE